MITRLKTKDTKAGTNRFVFRKASGADTMAPITVPIKAIHTVSNKRYPSPSFPAEKKKLQSGCRKPPNIFRKVCGLVREKSGGERVNVQIRNRAASNRISSLACSFFIMRSLRIKAARYLLKYSITHTVRNSISRMAPTLSYSSQEIFSLRSSPIPPAPTYPRIELCRTLVSNR